MELVKNLNWRYATKQFNTTKKISESDIENLKEAISLAPSSFGLQPYTVFVIKNPKIQEQLKDAAWGQTQVAEASHLFVFCNYKDLKENHIEELFDLKAQVYGKDKSEFEGYISFIKDKVALKTPEERAIWNSRQAYIGLGNLITACAELKIDACPMEGFDPKTVDEILDLESKGLDVVVLVAVGYRSNDDQTQHFPKVRKAKNILFETL